MRAGIAEFVFVLLLSTTGFAQDRMVFPLKLTVRSETSLAGFDLSSNTIEQVEDKFGKATKGTQFDETSNFEWGTDSCHLKVTAFRNWIEAIDVRGTKPDCIFGSTGRGLTLGASVRDAQRLYAIPVFVPGPFLEGPDWCRRTLVLEIEADEAGFINHLKLIDRTACY